MKKILPFLFLISCSHNPAIYPQNKTVPPQEEQSKEDIPIPENQEDISLNEEAQYKASLEKINERMYAEYSAYQECISLSKNSKQCKTLLESYCKIDTLIDNKYFQHFKPYCKSP